MKRYSYIGSQMNEAEAESTAPIAQPELTEAELAALKTDLAFFMHSWSREVAASRMNAQRTSALSLLGSFLRSATKNQIQTH